MKSTNWERKHIKTRRKHFYMKNYAILIISLQPQEPTLQRPFFRSLLNFIVEECNFNHSMKENKTLFNQWCQFTNQKKTQNETCNRKIPKCPKSFRLRAQLKWNHLGMIESQKAQDIIFKCSVSHYLRK